MAASFNALQKKIQEAAHSLAEARATRRINRSSALHPVYRQTCRICGSAHLTTAIDLGMQYLQGSFSKPGTIQPPLRKLPTRLVRCDVTANEHGCGLLQLAHSFPPEILYSNYWYRSATNETMRRHLKSIVHNVLETIPSPKPTVVDIGCNDGTLLSTIPKARPAMASIHRISPTRSATAPSSSTPCPLPSRLWPYFRPAAWTSSHRSRCSMTWKTPSTSRGRSSCY